MKLKPKHREVADHALVEVQTAEAYRPYDKLVHRSPKGRTIWTVLAWEPTGQGWTVTGIRCPPNCRDHRRRR